MDESSHRPLETRTRRMSIDERQRAAWAEGRWAEGRMDRWAEGSMGRGPHGQMGRGQHAMAERSRVCVPRHARAPEEGETLRVVLTLERGGDGEHVRCRAHATDLWCLGLHATHLSARFLHKVGFDEPCEWTFAVAEFGLHSVADLDV
jgi:hypothetical protein